MNGAFDIRTGKCFYICYLKGWTGMKQVNRGQNKVGKLNAVASACCIVLLSAQISTPTLMLSLTSTPTTLSLDVLSDLDYSLLSESLSLDTISVASTESVPPFPYGCMVPLSTFLAVNDHPYHLASSQLDAIPTITTTIPTPPRLRTLLKEDLCISRWTVCE